VNIVAYSYKGGSGRTTAAMNIAANLFRRGKIVCCIDFDIGAPGMHMILETTIPPREGETDLIARRLGDVSPLGVQHFFNNRYPRPGVDESTFVEQAVVDYKEHYAQLAWTEDDALNKRDMTQDAFDQGELLYLVASPVAESIRALDAQKFDMMGFRRRYRSLMERVADYINDKRGTDEVSAEDIYFVLDSASGLTPFSLPVLFLAHVVLVFFRWSHQHIVGTEQNAEILHHNLDERVDYSNCRIYKVGSCYVPAGDSDTLNQMKEEGDLAARRIFDRETELRTALESDRMIRFIDSIPEHPALKYYERIVALAIDAKTNYGGVREALDNICAQLEDDRLVLDID